MQLSACYGLLYFVARPNGHCVMRFQPKRKGYCLRSSACPGAVFRSLCSDTFAETVGCCILEYSRSYPNVESNITLPMFTKIFGDTTRSKAVFKHFLRSLKVAKAVSCAQQSAYITQVSKGTQSQNTLARNTLIECPLEGWSFHDCCQ